MKKSGGTLGAVSEAELKLLEGSFGALDIAQHPAVLKDNLNRVGSIYGRIVRAAQGDVSRIGGSAGAGGSTGTMGFNAPINLQRNRTVRRNANGQLEFAP